MEIRVLRYFLAVVNERNISHAAQKLHISQPTISRQIQDLEAELGVQLFQRGHRRLSLTPAGNYFADQARQIVALADKTLNNIQPSTTLQGEVLIGCAEAPMIVTIAQATKQLQKQAPQIRVNLHSSDANEVHQQLQNGVLDFGVVMEPTAKTDYHFLSLPGTTSWGVLVRRDSPLAKKATIKAPDLRNEPVILPQQLGNRDLLADWLGSNDSQPKVVASYNLIYNASLLALNRVGVVVGLNGIINPTNTELTFIPLSPRLEAHSSLIWSRIQPLSPAAQAFLKSIQTFLPQSTASFSPPV
ncbi:LysR family transcriptional regulator [Lactobacillus sp. DCY120]|uniref:LysR family transcriptional regulator n=1 Tax=Bombilactobacillus apium TaxID=2675299 RepID=A0A850R6E4_9LACO|nr:LysR family transcriptional regulator [Bombilactobacillus apium]NVY96115.1 LysR family transcriptional regulator [Bombilactobacillus apium]